MKTRSSTTYKVRNLTDDGIIPIPDGIYQLSSKYHIIPDNANKVSQCLPTTTIQQDAQEEEIRGRRKKRKTKEQRDAEALER